MGWLSDFLAKSDIVARDETVKTDAEPLWEQQTGSERRMVPNPLSDTSWLKDGREPKAPTARPEPDTDWAKGQRAYQEYADKHGEVAAGRIMDEAAAQSHPEFYTEKPPWQRAQENAHEPDVDPPSRGISPA